MLYEERPYLYLVVAAIAFIFARDSKLGIVSGLILVGCSALTLALRFFSRKRKNELLQKHGHLTEKIAKDKEKHRI